MCKFYGYVYGDSNGFFLPVYFMALSVIIDPREIRTGHPAKTMVETVKFLLFETQNSLKFSNSDDTCDRVL